MTNDQQQDFCREQATPEEIEAARDIWQCDDIQIDDDACTSKSQDSPSGYFVQAWVWIDTGESE